MKKSLWFFLLAVLGPSVVLGWLALRSAGEQQIILERRTAELYQKQTDSAADAVRALVDEERRAFNDAVRRLLAGENPAAVANDFPANLEKTWSRKAIGFAIGPDGRLLSPSPQRAQSNREWQRFLVDNGSFLAGSAPATVYWVSGDELARPEQLRSKSKLGEGSLASNQLFNNNVRSSAEPVEAVSKSSASAEDKTITPGKDVRKMAAQESRAIPPSPAAAAAPMAAPAAASHRKMDTPTPAEQTKQEAMLRHVAPQRVFNDTNAVAFSQLTAATADFRELTSGTTEGVITRFVQDKLEILFWLRPAQAAEMVFGCLIHAEDLRDVWSAALPAPPAGSSYDPFSRRAAPEFVLALLDDKTRPVATQPATTNGRDWKRPFVASEIGEALPHWEAALYLQRPEQLQESARVVRQTLVFLIAAALAIIVLGGWLVAADVRRQLALAQQKTDFVSNVSHELKTPLTSIRMFAELMQNGRGESTAKHPQYLRIIMVEAERLTRLINNVLDFARLERKQKQFDKKPLDLHAVIARTWEGHELHLRESGFTTRWQAAPGPYPVIGDEDALAQILVNLLSNAEKYAGERREVELHTYLDAGHACVSVLDRGIGVPPGDERKIFESFYRAHDSLSSGIQGSGLGLTLAQQLAREHGGEIVYRPREGGGSDFALRIPLAKPNQQSPISNQQ
jgi:signal transduction histidine kinase